MSGMHLKMKSNLIPVVVQCFSQEAKHWHHDFYEGVCSRCLTQFVPAELSELQIVFCLRSGTFCPFQEVTVWDCIRVVFLWPILHSKVAHYNFSHFWPFCIISPMVCCLIRIIIFEYFHANLQVLCQ